MENKPESMLENQEETAEHLASRYGTEHDADVVLYNAPIDDFGFYQLAKACLDQDRIAQNVLLILLTFGGRAEAAYKSARLLQDHYKRFTVFIPRQCKSAGTILTIGAHDIIMSEFGELGPLDVQVLKQDEFFEMSSGAAVVSALEMLQEKSFSLFEKFMFEIKAKSAGAVTLRTSTDIAASMTVGLFKEIFQQIDPNYLGEMSRNMRIAYEYGMRLAGIGQNIEADRINQLVYGYPNHEFVIDRREAKELFRHVREPDKNLDLIQTKLGQRVATLSITHDIARLSTDVSASNDQSDHDGGTTSNIPGEGRDDRTDDTRDADASRAEAANRATDREGAGGQGNGNSPEIDPTVLNDPCEEQNR